MSGTVPLTIGGAFNGQAGVVTVPSALLFGAQSDTTSLNSLLQTYLNGLTTGILSGADAFENNDLAGGLDTVHAASGTADATVELFSNISPTSVTGAATGNYQATVSSGVTDLAVQVPGNVTLAGVGSTTKAIFGANSNVDYSVLDPTAGSIYLAGGSNSITLGSFLTSNAETIYSAGSDSINLLGGGTDYVSVYGNAVVDVEAANAYVTAEGNATTNLFWDNANAGGTLHFINNSSAAARVQIGVFVDPATGLATSTAATHVTAFGGAGGGLYVGGAAGLNSLVGGTGAVTLVGAGNGDYLEANSSLPGLNGSGNDFFAGSGSETMVATSTTGANLFQVGLQYPGLGVVPGSGMISSSGSGIQTYFLGNSPGETIYGSTNASFNVYNFVGDSTAGGGTFDIYNFSNTNSVIFLVDATDSAPGAAHVLSMGADPNFAGQYDITLSDNTTIRLHNPTGTVSAAPLSNGIIAIT